MNYRLVPLSEEQPSVQISSDEAKHDVVAFDITPSSRFVIGIEVGDLPPTEALAFLERVKRQLESKEINGQPFFPKGSCLFTPLRHGKPTIIIFKLEPDDDSANPRT